MVQLTLDQYICLSRPLGASKGPKVTFLHLPFALRRRIYLDAGLPSKSTIYLNYAYSSNDHCNLEYDPDNIEQWPTEETISARSSSLSYFLEDYPPWPRICLNRHCLCFDKDALTEAVCRCNALPYQLLFISKPITKEVSMIFYSENDFSVYRTGLGGLTSLSRLPSNALACMRSLSVCLNINDKEDGWGRYFGPDSGGHCHATCAGSKFETPFSNIKRRDERAALKEWQLLCTLLRSKIQPNSLKLFLTCDVADIEIAKEVIQPLLDLPGLQDCAVRLGSRYIRTGIDYSDTLTELARQTVKTVTNCSTQQNFRYQDLPEEIQIQILEYTELVTPFDLVWAFNTNVAKYIKSPYYEHRTFFHCDILNSSSCCQACSPDSQLCACWSRRAAFSTTCTCWRFPLSLFLVNRKIKSDAELVFYSRNRFLLLPRHYNHSEHLEIYNFLRYIPKNGQRYLRSVYWTLSSLHNGNRYLEPDHFTWSEWLVAINILVQEVLPGQLNLTIDPDFDLRIILYTYGSDYMFVPEDCGIEEAEQTWTVCERVVNALSEKHHLGSLCVRFIWPFEKHKDNIPRDRGAILQKRVMNKR